MLLCFSRFCLEPANPLPLTISFKGPSLVGTVHANQKVSDYYIARGHHARQKEIPKKTRDISDKV